MLAVTPAQLTELKPAFDALGSYPILQFFGGLIILMTMGFGGMLWLRGEKAAKAEANKPLAEARSQDAAVQLFFDGPLKAIFDTLHLIQTNQALNKLESKDVTAQIASAAKRELFDGLHEVQKAILRETTEQHDKLCERIDSLERQLVDMRDMAIRVEATMMRRRQ
jgi:hypothetical protein